MTPIELEATVIKLEPGDLLFIKYKGNLYGYQRESIKNSIQQIKLDYKITNPIIFFDEGEAGEGRFDFEIKKQELS